MPLWGFSRRFSAVSLGSTVRGAFKTAVVKTLPLVGPAAGVDDNGMFLRSYKRWKNGKQHRYFSIVENRRIAGRGCDGKRIAQRTVLYLGEINDSQQAA